MKGIDYIGIYDNTRTCLEACIPRYIDYAGNVVSIEVPWALPNSRMSWLMKKDDRLSKSTKNQTKVARLLHLSFSEVHNGTCCSKKTFKT